MQKTCIGRRAWIGAFLATGAVLAGTLTACTTASSDPSSEVVLLASDSFDMPDELVGKFQDETGLTLRIDRVSGSGELASSVALTAGSPRGDAVFGIDNTFAARVLDQDAMEPYTSPLADGGSADYAVEGAEDELTAVSLGYICLNYDEGWYNSAGIAEPDSLDDLADPVYRDQAVLIDPSSSSVGMGFLLATVGAKQGAAPDFWRQIVGNGAKVVSTWSIAYNQEFSAGEGRGDRPIVVSYASSPAATEGTRAILNGCFEQIEYAGVLRGAANPDGARKLVDFLLSPEMQAAMPTANYVYPVQRDAVVPPAWQQRAQRPPYTVKLTPAFINENYENWLTQWREVTGR